MVDDKRINDVITLGRHVRLLYSQNADNAQRGEANDFLSNYHKTRPEAVSRCVDALYAICENDPRVLGPEPVSPVHYDSMCTLIAMMVRNCARRDKRIAGHLSQLLQVASRLDKCWTYEKSSSSSSTARCGDDVNVNVNNFTTSSSSTNSPNGHVHRPNSAKIMPFLAQALACSFIFQEKDEVPIDMILRDVNEGVCAALWVLWALPGEVQETHSHGGARFSHLGTFRNVAKRVLTVLNTRCWDIFSGQQRLLSSSTQQPLQQQPFDKSSALLAITLLETGTAWVRIIDPMVLSGTDIGNFFLLAKVCMNMGIGNAVTNHCNEDDAPCAGEKFLEAMIDQTSAIPREDPLFVEFSNNLLPRLTGAQKSDGSTSMASLRLLLHALDLWKGLSHAPLAHVLSQIKTRAGASISLPVFASIYEAFLEPGGDCESQIGDNNNPIPIDEDQTTGRSREILRPPPPQWLAALITILRSFARMESENKSFDNNTALSHEEMGDLLQYRADLTQFFRIAGVRWLQWMVHTALMSIYGAVRSDQLMGDVVRDFLLPTNASMKDDAHHTDVEKQARYIEIEEGLHVLAAMGDIIVESSNDGLLPMKSSVKACLATLSAHDAVRRSPLVARQYLITVTHFFKRRDQYNHGTNTTGTNENTITNYNYYEKSTLTKWIKLALESLGRREYDEEVSEENPHVGLKLLLLAAYERPCCGEHVEGADVYQGAAGSDGGGAVYTLDIPLTKDLFEALLNAQPMLRDESSLLVTKCLGVHARHETVLANELLTHFYKYLSHPPVGSPHSSSWSGDFGKRHFISVVKECAGKADLYMVTLIMDRVTRDQIIDDRSWSMEQTSELLKALASWPAMAEVACAMVCSIANGGSTARFLLEPSLDAMTIIAAHGQGYDTLAYGLFTQIAALIEASVREALQWAFIARCGGAWPKAEDLSLTRRLLGLAVDLSNVTSAQDKCTAEYAKWQAKVLLLASSVLATEQPTFPKELHLITEAIANASSVSFDMQNVPVGVLYVRGLLKALKGNMPEQESEAVLQCLYLLKTKIGHEHFAQLISMACDLAGLPTYATTVAQKQSFVQCMAKQCKGQMFKQFVTRFCKRSMSCEELQ